MGVAHSDCRVFKIEDFGVVAKEFSTMSNDLRSDHIKVLDLSGSEVGQDTS